jgi:hypothetical protein
MARPSMLAAARLFALARSGILTRGRAAAMSM